MVTALLFNGIRGPARCRSSAARAAAPRACCVCGSEDPELAWLTPGPGPGTAWCSSCIDADAVRREGALWVRNALGEAGLPQGPNAWRLHWQAAAHPQDPCPLCGFGELGSEHLLLWCPAVSLACQELGRIHGAASAISLLGIEGAEVKRKVAALFHQVTFLALAAQTRVTFHYRAAANWINRAVGRGGTAEDPDSDEESTGHAIALERLQGAVPVWKWETHCRICIRGTGSVRNSRGLAAAGERVPRLTIEGAAGEIVATLYSHAAPAAWPLPGDGPFSAPRVGASTCRRGPGMPAAQWEIRRCSECQQFAAALRLERAAQAGEEVRVAAPGPFLRDAAADSAWLLWADGCGPERDGPPIGGAGFVLQRVDAEGQAGPFLEAAGPLPGCGDGLHAEARALGAALAELARLQLPRRRVCVIGDCAPVLHSAAGGSGARGQPIQSLFKDALGAVLQQGWVLEWRVVHRSLNRAADALAREGRARAPRAGFARRGAGASAAPVSGW